MPQFQYTAVNSDAKKLNGVIGAESENDARKQLNTLGISVLSIKTIKDKAKVSVHSEKTVNLKKYEFEAYDKTGRKIVGTIPASSRYKAFKRLMEEYEFEVSFVVHLNATEEEKAKAKTEDLSILQKEYEEKTEPSAEEEEASKVDKNFEKKKSDLLEKVDHILTKIKTLIAQYAADIKPENKKLIDQYVDKLLRIKSSTNLEYIEHISEELLKKVQDQELFLHKENMQAEQEKVKLETQKMMAELHARPVEEKSLLDDLSNLEETLTESKNPILKGLAENIKNWLPSPEAKLLKDQIKQLNKQVWTFWILKLKASKSVKAEANANLQKVVDEKTRLKKELKSLQLNEVKNKKDVGQLDEPLITEELKHFLGWLLMLYLVAYFLSYYYIAKDFPGGNPLPGEFNLLHSSMLRSLLISIFLWYILLNLRIEYLRYKSWANLLIFPLGIILNASLIFNL
ncbi:hypothetical protein HOD30_04030 [Candidatus Peregrinibacteria bacterium]|jgi:hypothetical protein|nr:hypothetical protein [Candidatus Peregrinibacteria bacterium]MBT4632129.1 hypothetical protein [Candidatus Peregrinibacteria bacterium]